MGELVIYTLKNAPSQNHIQALLGGKAKNLVFLESAGAPVPAWFCVGAEAFELFLQPVFPQIEKLLEGLEKASAEQVENVSRQIQKLIQNTPVAAPLQAQIEQHAFAFFAGKQVAVRSSGVGEDSASDSYAGQFDTFLCVQHNEICKYILECWASAFGARVLTYMNLRSGSFRPMKMAVLVQEMVEAQRAGVMFTSNPDGRLNELLIAAGFGLGEGIVTDQAETDLFTYDRFTKKIASKIQKKTTQVVRNSAVGKGTLASAVPTALADLPCLNSEQVLELARLGELLERVSGHPQDIEWAYDEKNSLCILQTRPITTLPAGDLVLVDNSNVSESYPGISSRLTFSVVSDLYSHIFSAGAVRVGAPAAVVEGAKQMYDKLVVHVQGRIYYSLSSWYQMFQQIPGAGKYVAVWEEMLGIEPSSTQGSGAYQKLLKGLGALRTWGLLVLNYFRLDGELSRQRQRFASVHSHFLNTPLSNYSTPELLNVHHDHIGLITHGWEVTLLNDGYVFILSAVARAALKKLGCENAPTLLNDLFSGAQMESAEAFASVNSLSQEIRWSQTLREALRTEGLRALEQKEFASFAQQFQNHIHRFGERVVAELKLETPTFRQSPELLLALLLQYADTPENAQTGAPQSEHLRRRNANAELEALSQKKPLLGILAKGLVDRARLCMIWRENSRLDRARAYGIARAIFWEMGTRLTATGVLNSPEQIYHFSISDLTAAFEVDSTGNTLKMLLDVRKSESESWNSLDPEERFWLRGNVEKNIIPQKAIYKYNESDSGTDEHGNILLSGTGSSAGVFEGEALVVLRPELSLNTNNKILIAQMTDPGWVFLMISAGALVSEKGSILSHTAIIGRELGIPTVVGVKNATKLIGNGERWKIDGTHGKVTRSKI